MLVFKEWMVGWLPLTPSVCSSALNAPSGGLLLTFCYRKLSLGCMVFDLSHAKQCVTVV